MSINQEIRKNNIVLQGRILGLEKEVEELKEERRWRPMETAPKDGTIIDVLLNGSVKSRIPNVHWGIYDGIERKPEVWLDDLNNPVIFFGGGCNKITHWMPIPQLTEEL